MVVQMYSGWLLRKNLLDELHEYSMIRQYAILESARFKDSSMKNTKPDNETLPGF